MCWSYKPGQLEVFSALHQLSVNHFQNIEAENWRNVYVIETQQRAAEVDSKRRQELKLL